MKQCNKCKEIKPISEYSKAKNYSGGYNAQCKQCRKSYYKSNNDLIDRRRNNGGRRKGAGRKKGIGMSYDIKKHCDNFMMEMFKDEAIRNKALKQVEQSISKNENTNKGIVYIISTQDNLYKIGYTSDLNKRIKNYNAHNLNSNLVFYIQSEFAFDLEGLAHKFLLPFNEGGEWFRLNEQNLIKAISYISNENLTIG